MPPTPLELPEILSLVAAYLPPRSLPACARISKAWYQACVPFIWKSIDLKDQPMAPIQSHSHLVKKVRIACVREEHNTVRFPNLDSLELNFQGHQHSAGIQFVMEHPTITRLELRTLFSGSRTELWDNLLGFRYLKTLALTSKEAFGLNIDKFWQLCTRLERLDIYVRHYSNLRFTMPPGELTSIRDLGVYGCYSNNVPVFTEFIRRCPRLTSIHWHTSGPYEKTFISGLVALLEAKTLPDLEYLEARTRKITNHLFTRLIKSMSRITGLLVDFSKDSMRMDFAALIEPHFSNLRVLEMNVHGYTTSPVAQIVMSSCPLLERLVAPCVDALVVAEGKPWVCLRLMFLDLAFSFGPPSTLNHLQPLVFDQLSKLTRLEEWHITGPTNCGVDLRIEKGLHRLSTLRLLRSVILHDIVERMGDVDVEWMLEHWKSLAEFRGSLNTYDDKIRRALENKLEGHGIKG
ncbi:MAG: hypothetical protein J3Q66DRAFT_437653 [Benniella sp.]|nr:MAG: hypothetical protein J3Q66DRAFT_437653 [Benniella sp.]